LASYGLKEIQQKGSIASGYMARTKMNVDSSDGTIAFRLHPSVGTDKTIQYCASGQWGKDRREGGASHRPCLVVTSLSDDDWAPTVKEIQLFIETSKVRKLNVAGHREPPPDCLDFDERVTLLMQEVLADFI